QPGDFPVLNGLQGIGIGLTTFALRTRLLEGRCAQQAADVISAEGRSGAGHGWPQSVGWAKAAEVIPIAAQSAFRRAHRSAAGGHGGPRLGAPRATPRPPLPTLRITTRRHPQTSRATSTRSRSFAHCSSSVSTLPSSVEANPHCGESASWSSATYFVASSMRRLRSSLFSGAPSLEDTRPSTTIFLPFGT